MLRYRLHYGVKRAYYVIRWSSEKATWEGIYTDEFEKMKQQGHVPPL
jgi:hypothetical protein